jgi:hypothetical protein
MIEKTTTLSADAMKQAYGDLWAMGRRVAIDCKKIPTDLHGLIPYAEFWGVSDDLTREKLIENASADALANMKAVVARIDDKLNAWLASQETDGPNPNPLPTKEYIAFVALIMAADFV